MLQCSKFVVGILVVHTRHEMKLIFYLDVVALFPPNVNLILNLLVFCKPTGGLVGIKRSTSKLIFLMKHRLYISEKSLV